jgi:predicted NUDIX family NTP pyrophosphohydrolase
MIGSRERVLWLWHCKVFSRCTSLWYISASPLMPKISAGLLMYRARTEHRASPEVLLVHPGGPFWKNKDDGAWMIPKGEVEPGEDLLAAAIREFSEETALTPVEPFLALGQVKHKSGKNVHAWAFQGDCEPNQIRSNTFELEWPPKSGRKQEFPEIDRADFFDLSTARRKILPAELPLLDRFVVVIGGHKKAQKTKGSNLR